VTANSLDENHDQTDESMEQQVADIHWLAFSMALRGFEEKTEKAQRRSSRTSEPRKERRRLAR